MTGSRKSWMALASTSIAFLFAACASVAAEPAKPTTATTPAAASGGEWKGKNLQILPATMPRGEVIAVMKNFSTALGVECSFCHANGADGKLDPASDAKREKASARWMMTMVRELNTKFHVTDMSKPEVTCYTCHRGAAHPLTAPDSKPEPHKH
jgi:hypothetical protein